MIFTEEILEQGKSINGGWNTEQLTCLGETFLKGWRRRLLGRDYPEETIKNFIDLKNSHKPKVKKKATVSKTERVQKINTTVFKYLICFDGACEPKNPNGNMGMGCVIFDITTGEEVFSHSSCIFLGEYGHSQTSNNLAEYLALIEGLTYLYDNNLTSESIRCYGDSKLVVNQMSGYWKIKEGIYVKAALEAKEMLSEFSNINFQWIPREENNLADDLSKKSMIERKVEFRIQPQ